MNIQLMQDMLHEVIDEHFSEDYDLAEFDTRTFEDAGLLTNDKGIVISFKEGRTFNIIIQEG